MQKDINIPKKIEEYSELIGQNGEFTEKFAKFYDILIEYNNRYNLTAITERKEVFYKHFLDSAVGEFLLPQNAKVLEVGSGAGFPSMVLKLLRPDLRFTLVESVGKKCEFLKAFAKEMALENVEVLNVRAEDLARDKNYREQYDVVCARAVARMNTLSEYCIPFVKKGGMFLAYKGGDAEEVEESKPAFKILGCKLKESYFYELPEGYGKRSLIAVEKEKNTPEKYPRGNGKERKAPLK